MEDFKCRLCNVICTGPETYKQHIEGVKHKKKETLQAEICQCVRPLTNIPDNIKSDSISNLDQRMLNPDIQGLNDTRQSINEGERNYSAMISHDQQHLSGGLQTPVLNLLQHNSQDFMSNNFCRICNVLCSGPMPYEQHIKGKNHIKREKLLNISSSNENSISPQNATSTTGGSISTREMDFTDFDHPQSDATHSNDKGAEPKSSYEILDEKPIAVQPNTVGEAEPIDVVQRPQYIENIQPFMNYNCDLCKINCTGLDQYNQHLVGKQHKKKITFQSPAAGTTTQNPRLFLPQSPFVSQNLKSGSEGTFPDSATNEVTQMNINKKPKYDTENSNLFSVSRTTGTSLSDYKNVNPRDYTCHICDVICTGVEPYEQHIRGKLHQKKAAQKNLAYPDSSSGVDVRESDPRDIGRLALSNFVPDKNSLLQLGITVIEPDDEVTLDIF